jgi:hypothetical protein
LQDRGGHIQNVAFEDLGSLKRRFAADAGALGASVWILLPYLPDYRWLLDRDDSPWYPTARLYRQTASRDYADVLGRVRADLNQQIAAWHRSK